jgi:hypothetical protein
MEALRHAAEPARAGHGQIVAAMAEAGVGKSRLFLEFKAKNQSGWMVLEAFSVSHGKASAYLPVLDLLYTYFKITSDDAARARREKVAGKITVLDRALEDTLPYLFALLGIVEGEDPLARMDANLRKRRTLDAIKRVLVRESLNQPLIVMFEDPLDRRADSGVPQPARRLARQCEAPASGELPARVLAPVGLEDLLHANSGSTRSAPSRRPRCCPRCSVTLAT